MSRSEMTSNPDFFLKCQRFLQFEIIDTIVESPAVNRSRSPPPSTKKKIKSHWLSQMNTQNQVNWSVSSEEEPETPPTPFRLIGSRRSINSFEFDRMWLNSTASVVEIKTRLIDPNRCESINLIMIALKLNEIKCWIHQRLSWRPSFACWISILNGGIPLLHLPSLLLCSPLQTNVHTHVFYIANGSDRPQVPSINLLMS